MRAGANALMPLSPTRRKTAVKQIVCTHCEQPTEVARRAMSVFCPHCSKRLVLENFNIRSYYAVRDFVTCGDIVVEKKGHVVATIKATNLAVKGKVNGRITARGKVSILRTGSFKGELEAPCLLIEGGAMLDGFVRIGPPADA